MGSPPTCHLTPVRVDGVFVPLRDVDFFRRLEIDEGGNTINGRTSRHRARTLYDLVQSVVYEKRLRCSGEPLSWRLSTLGAERRVKLSVVIPAQNEEGSSGTRSRGSSPCSEREQVDYEVVVVDDGSEDSTAAVVEAIGAATPRPLPRSHYEKGFGWRSCGARRLRRRLGRDRDGRPSDDPRTSSATTADGGRLVLPLRLALRARRRRPRLPAPEADDQNRLANWFIRTLFRHRYKRHHQRLQGLPARGDRDDPPLISKHFNLRRDAC